MEETTIIPTAVQEALDESADETITSVVPDDGATESTDKRTQTRPDVSWLEPAMTNVEGVGPLAMFKEGDRIVIERFVTIKNTTMWLDTQTYIVRTIDDDTGDLRLYNPDLHQYARGNFIVGPARGDNYYLAPERGAVGRRKRGRPANLRRQVEPPPVVPLAEGEKRGRGRPKGSKNRPRA